MTYEGEEPIEVNGKKVVAFKESGTWTIPEGVTNVDVLVVAGGGGGGFRGGHDSGGGGGGAGGLVFESSHSVKDKTSIPLTIGAGGGVNDEDNGSDGGDSTFDNITAIGGGGGARFDLDGNDGGSGGGAAGRNIEEGGSGGSGTDNQGNNGGSRNFVGDAGGAGGGGAGEAGSNIIDDPVGRPGGVGLNFADIFGTNYGEIDNGDAWFAGGGGGGGSSLSGGSDGAGGKGGGGNGNDSATANTGGGGGGGNRTSPNPGAGGSGIVIIRYREPVTIKGKVTLNSNNIEGATVRLINSTTGSYVGDTLTDAQGEYEFKVESDTDDYHAMVEYESGENKYHAVSYPFLKGGEDE